VSKDRYFSTGGRRDSAEGKPPLSKLAFSSLCEVASVHQFGDDHYGAGNWRKGQPTSVLLDCVYRHLAAFTRGEDLDPKSKLSHLAHAAWNVLVLIHQTVCYPEEYRQLDDRMDDLGRWVSDAFAETPSAKALSKEHNV